MADLSYFESRSGKLSCNAEEFFAFVTDFRNFGQFIPTGSINDWNAEKESCSFVVPMIGTVALRLIEKEEFSKVIFYGDALKKNDFRLTLNISDSDINMASVKVLLSADLNPMMRMVATKPIGRFMEVLIDEMERFKGWHDTKG